MNKMKNDFLAFIYYDFKVFRFDIFSIRNLCNIDWNMLKYQEQYLNNLNQIVIGSYYHLNDIG